jgi:hypothetical protein
VHTAAIRVCLFVCLSVCLSVLFCSFLFRSVLSCSALICSVLFCSVLLCSVLLCSVVFCYVVLCCVVLCSVLSVMFSSVLICFVLFFPVLFCLHTHTHPHTHTTDFNQFRSPFHRPLPRSARSSANRERESDSDRKCYSSGKFKQLVWSESRGWIWEYLTPSPPDHRRSSRTSQSAPRDP